MSRLVVVSNRVVDPRKTAAGGLAVAVGDALQRTGGVWFGWSGRIVEPYEAAESAPQIQRTGPVTLATIDLSQEEHDAYYLGFSNRVLWPVCHYRLDLADFDASLFDGYRRVNARFARRLAPLLRKDDVIWVHDYHLIPLADELRALGVTNRIGFFLHIPLPPPPLLAAIPSHEWLMRALFAYDLVGLQSKLDLEHFQRYVRSEADAEPLPEDHYRAFGRIVRAGAFPIGIDVDDFQKQAAEEDAMEMYRLTCEQYAKRKLLVGVDRLDYSKGLPHRLRALRVLLERYPETRNVATLIQIASPTREDVEAYARIRRELEHLAGAINGDYGELDWMPVRYMHRTIARRRLPGLLRAGKVALVTPLRDGMNLVAKEFVAAQDADDPGVLVLSRFAGAAEQMRDALLVNPYDIEGTAHAIGRALAMPAGERRERHASLLAGIKRHDLHHWRRSFLEALAGAQQDVAQMAA